MRFSEESLIALHDSVREQMSEYRFIHTAEVEKMAVRLGNLYAPDKLDILRAAALLHDITKEYGIDAHAELIERGGESLSALDRLSYKTLHARSAVELIKEKYGDFAYSEVLDAVRYHTTGRA
ncbi:MAG: HD domain-containing protein, partial [Clostridia bacterium]|nr:HD domain-containing protein [Clostridia bacterium]